MYGLPNWLASYLAKKITRLAFSVYRSNIWSSCSLVTLDCRVRQSGEFARIEVSTLKILSARVQLQKQHSLIMVQYRMARTSLKSQHPIALPRKLQIMSDEDRGETALPPQIRQ